MRRGQKVTVRSFAIGKVRVCVCVLCNVAALAGSQDSRLQDATPVGLLQGGDAGCRALHAQVVEDKHLRVCVSGIAPNNARVDPVKRSR